MKAFLKTIFSGVFLVLCFPLALLSGFGRLEGMYLLWAQACALCPGLPGDYFRIAYYRLTLKSCGQGSRIQFGSFFAHPQVSLGSGVYIGSYCVFGRTSIGNRTQIASGVQILSGARQHKRDEAGKILGSEVGEFLTVNLGADCWIGAGAIVMADVGEGTTIGAGSIVTRSIPAHCVAVGNPARVLTPEA